MATLWLNFDLGDVSFRAPISKPWSFVGLDGRRIMPGEVAVIPWGKLWLAHGPWNAGYDPSRVIYAVRDPVSTLMSFWRLYDPEMMDFPAKWIGEERVKHWYRQTLGYVRSGCTVVRYEDLVGERHDIVVATIGDRHGLTLKQDGIKRFEKRIGWYSEKTPQQPKEPPQMLLNAVKKIVPRGFLGYGQDL